MKKFIALAVLAFSGAAFAGGFGSVEYQNRDGVDGGADARATKVTIGTNLSDNVKADVSLRQKTDDSSNLSDNRLEAGLTFSTPIAGSLSGYARGAVGQKYKTSENYNYYSVEPGIKYQLTDSLSIKAGYRYRDAITTGHTDQTRATRLGAEYALTKNYTIGVGYDRVRGDSEYNSYNLALGFKF